MCPSPPGHHPERWLSFLSLFPQVITLSDDHVVRVWDLRNHKCVQALGNQGEWAGAGRQAGRQGGLGGVGLLWSREHAVSNQVSSSRVDCVVCVQSCVAWLRCTCPVLRSHASLSATPVLPPAADWLRPEDSKPSAIAYDSSRRRLVWCVIPYACIRLCSVAVLRFLSGMPCLMHSSRALPPAVRCGCCDRSPEWQQLADCPTPAPLCCALAVRRIGQQCWPTGPWRWTAPMTPAWWLHCTTPPSQGWAGGCEG